MGPVKEYFIAFSKLIHILYHREKDLTHHPQIKIKIIKYFIIRFLLNFTVSCTAEFNNIVTTHYLLLNKQSLKIANIINYVNKFTERCKYNLNIKLELLNKKVLLKLLNIQITNILSLLPDFVKTIRQPP